MDFFNEILDIFKFNNAQKRSALDDFNSFIKPRVAQELILLLPQTSLKKAQEVENHESTEGQKKIASIITQNLSREKIEEVEKAIVGQTIIEYINFMFKDANLEQQTRAKEVFTKHGIQI